MTGGDKFAGKASGWTAQEYARPEAYLSHRADLIHTLGPALHAGDVVLDLACADGGLADFLPEQRYVGVDASEEMVVAGRERGRELVHADLNDYEPTQPVQATTIFRALYYARDRRQLFERIAGYTERKLVFDVNPRQYRLEDVQADLRAAGFDDIETRPFFVPQTHAVPLLTVFEYSPLVARLLLRYRFTLLCAASRRAGAS
jgi:trans-aconitate methyltransferase